MSINLMALHKPSNILPICSNDYAIKTRIDFLIYDPFSLPRSVSCPLGIFTNYWILRTKVRMSTGRIWTAKCETLKLSLSLAPVHNLQNENCLSVTYSNVSDSTMSLLRAIPTFSNLALRLNLLGTYCYIFVYLYICIYIYIYI